MSRTYKVTSFNQTEDYINKLMNSQNALRSQINSVERNAKQAAREEAARRVQVIRNEMNMMEHNLQNQLSGLSDKMRSNYLEHNRALRKQAVEFQNNLNTLKNWTQSTINNLRDDVNTKFREQQSQISNNKSRIDTIYQKEVNISKQAKRRLNDLKILLKVVDKNNNHEKYANGELAQLQRRVDSISNPNIPAESIIGETISITNDLYDLEEKIAKEKTIFEAKHTLVLELAQELLKTMHDNRTSLYFTDEDGKELIDEDGKKIQVEVDYWTDNKYQELEEESKALEKELIEVKESVELDNDRLDELQKHISEIKTEQDALVMLACERGLASEERATISEDFVEAFMEQGFWLKDEEDSIFFEGNSEKGTKDDFREGVATILVNEIGTELTIRVVPDENKKNNLIHFHRNDNRNMTQKEYMELLEKVKRIMSKTGAEMGELKAPKVGDVRIEELADVNALKKGLSKKVKTIN